MLVSVQLDGKERRLAIDEFEARVRDGTIGPETPVERDGTWIAARDWPGWNEWIQSPQRAIASRWREPIVPWATALVVGAAVRSHFFWPAAASGGEDPRASYSRATAAIFEHGESWRLLSSAFVHADVGHILSNCTALAVGGIAMEKLLGWRAFCAVLALSTAAGGLWSSLWLTEAESVGISGGVFGVLGACAVIGLRFRDVVPRSASAAFGAVTALFTANALYNGLISRGVDNWAHAGGLFTGLLLGVALRPEIPAWREGNRRATLAMGALLAGALFGVGLFGDRMLPWTTLQADGAVAERPAWWTVQVSRAGLRGWGSPDRDSAVSITTRKEGVPPTPASVMAAELARVRRLDPSAALSPDTARAEGGSVRYRADGVERVLHLRVAVRGLYATVGAVDVAEGTRMEAALLERAVDGWELVDPPAVARAREGEGGNFWKGRVEAAVAAVEMGEDARGRRLFDEARALAPTEDDVEIAAVRALGAVGAPDVGEVAARALERFPESRRLAATVAAVLPPAESVPAAGGP